MCKNILNICLFAIFVLLTFPAYTANMPISLFPLDRYPQTVSTWLPPEEEQYKKPLLTPDYQQTRLQDYYKHTITTDASAVSPWSKNFVVQILNKNPGVLDFVKSALTEYSNHNKSAKTIGYGENFHPHTSAWITHIVDNIDLQQFTPPLSYKSTHRGIVVKNTLARMLPAHDPHYYHFEIPGQGYPFDNLQASALWVGSPVYIIGQTKDNAWSLVMTPSFVAWVANDAIANADNTFIQRWEKLLKSQSVAITHTQTTIIDAQTHKFQLAAYVGTVLPLLQSTANYFKVTIPKQSLDGSTAILREALIAKKYAAKMPLPATPENFATLFNTLKNRPYGWGNSSFYNDCSSELQNLYTPFGIWLPRNSSKQHMVGKVFDLTAEAAEKRLHYLIQNGHPLTTLIIIPGHVLMYIGAYPNPHDKNQTLMAMSYQNVWGLRPTDGEHRAVIGQSLFLPLLLSYPEDNSLTSFANTKRFQMIYLDQWPEQAQKATDLFF